MSEGFGMSVLVSGWAGDGSILLSECPSPCRQKNAEKAWMPRFAIRAQHFVLRVLKAAQ
jgi:hypothetical protein